MVWIPNSTAQAQQQRAASSQAPYTGSPANNPNLPQSIRDQYAGAQQLQNVATSSAPYSSGGITGLKALAGYLGGSMENQADQAATASQGSSPSQPSPSLLASVLRAGTGSSDPSTPGAPMQLAGATPPDPNADPSSSNGTGLLGLIGRKSDRRLKSDVTRIGTLSNGLPVYRHRLDGGPFEVGCMADEVAQVRPDATWFDPDDGFARVDYSKVA